MKNKIKFLQIRDKIYYRPFPRIALVQQGSCCGNGCLNCPYVPKHKKGSIELDNNNKPKEKKSMMYSDGFDIRVDVFYRGSCKIFIDENGKQGEKYKRYTIIATKILKDGSKHVKIKGFPYVPYYHFTIADKTKKTLLPVKIISKPVIYLGGSSTLFSYRKVYKKRDTLWIKTELYIRGVLHYMFEDIVMPQPSYFFRKRSIY